MPSLLSLWKTFAFKTQTFKLFWPLWLHCLLLLLDKSHVISKLLLKSLNKCVTVVALSISPDLVNISTLTLVDQVWLSLKKLFTSNSLHFTPYFFCFEKNHFISLTFVDFLGVTGNGKLLLVHGYCANGNPFTASDFTNYLEFNDPNANRNLDTFANLILDFAEKNSVDSYSIVAHSQVFPTIYYIYWFYREDLPLCI